MFHYFTLEEIYQFAESLGYTREDVEFDEIWDEDLITGYYVTVGDEYGEDWCWEFESLTEPAVAYYGHSYEWEKED